MLTYCKHYILLIGLAFFAVSSIHADDLEQRKQLLKKQFHQYYAQMKEEEKTLSDDDFGRQFLPWVTRLVDQLFEVISSKWAVALW